MQIHILDLHFQQLSHAIAAYLLAGPAGYVLIETGPDSTRRMLIQQLAAHGVSPADIRHVLVTHIHLDHAGCAGWWAQQGATIYVHPVGAPHLIDPSRLLASAGRIYGDQMDTLWGQVLPAPEANVVPVTDGQQIEVAGLTLTAIESPGHAGHHHVYRLGDIAFAGDAAGVRLPDSDWISVPAVPPEFKPELWLQTIDRLERESFQAIYPTHFGRVDDVPTHLARLRSAIIAVTNHVREGMEAGQERDTILRHYRQWQRDLAIGRGATAEIFNQYEAANPLYMSVDGIIRYWRKKEPQG
jgi:glyoxylase-like metal-dependent hydrolase (beta-lactamase superfamily II)